MIALVSEQRMQNIIPAIQKDSGIDRVVLIASREAEDTKSKFAKALNDTLEALNEKGVESVRAKSFVDAYDIEATRRIVDNELAEVADPSEAVVNFTGGTKCMSIGAYIAARDRKSRALYVDTANEKIVLYQPDGEVALQEFELRGLLTVRIYLRANGQQIDEKRTKEKALSATALQVARSLAKIWPVCIDTLDTLGKSVSQSSALLPSTGMDSQTLNVLKEAKYIREVNGQWQVRQAGNQFVSGGWLEAMVRALLEDSKLFDDVQSMICLRGVENELDGLATRNGQLALIECKSGDLGGQTTLNKLQAIRSRCGLFARTFFVTSRMSNEVDDTFKQRAQQYGVREIITQETLPEIASIIEKKMRGTT